MLLFLLCFQAVVQGPVLSETTLAPPQNVRLDKWLLTWVSGKEEDVTYIVEYESSREWRAVPGCARTSLNSCNVSLAKPEEGEECVRLRVRAKRGGVLSKSVEACSTHGDTCTPTVSLSAQPGSLTVHLSRNHSLAMKNGDLVKHRVYYGKEGEPLEKAFKDSTASLHIPGLEEGQRYCVKVQYVYFRNCGVESCIQCEVIPKSSRGFEHAAVIAVVVVAMCFAIAAAAFVLIFKRKWIKLHLRPPYEIPYHFNEKPSPLHNMPSFSSGHAKEDCDIISSLTRRE